jgi:hypothetical protein
MGWQLCGFCGELLTFIDLHSLNQKLHTTIQMKLKLKFKVCLFLNLVTPETRQQKLPVVISIQSKDLSFGKHQVMSTKLHQTHHNSNKIANLTTKYSSIIPLFVFIKQLSFPISHDAIKSSFSMLFQILESKTVFHSVVSRERD